MVGSWPITPANYAKFHWCWNYKVCKRTCISILCNCILAILGAEYWMRPTRGCAIIHRLFHILFIKVLQVCWNILFQITFVPVFTRYEHFLFNTIYLQSLWLVNNIHLVTCNKICTEFLRFCIVYDYPLQFLKSIRLRSCV